MERTPTVPDAPFDPATAVRLAQFVRQIQGWDPETAPGPVLPPFGYELLHLLIANDLVPGLPDFDVYGYIARSPDGSDLVLAIRGTSGILEWLKDFQFFLTAYPYAPGAGRVAGGFLALYASLGITQGTMPGSIVPDPGSPRVTEVLRGLLTGPAVQTLHIVGHSLGAALATLLALDIVASRVYATPEVITFGSPAVGDKRFAGTYDARVPGTWRIANPADLITHLPLPVMGFVHVDREQPLAVGHEPLLRPDCQHALDTYLNALDPTFAKAPGC
jgi:pimeloyl-ACP methyl ester carboxylesterase